jgi:hypothetical membrane protein
MLTGTRSLRRSDLALAGMVQPVWLLGGSLLMGALRPGYEPLRDAISELGEQGAANALLWNVGGFGVMAVLYAVYSVAMRAEFGGGWLFLLVAIQAIASAGGGVFSCDPGCPPVPQSPSMWGHTISGLTYFAITSVIPLAAWRPFRARKEWRSLAPASLGVGLLLVLLFFIGPILGPDRVGVWQRVDLVVAYAWQIAVALRLRAVLSELSGAAREDHVRRTGGLAGLDPPADRIA